jgi:hypothetical protein
MTDRAQFEAMLEALINEDQDKAKEIFHNIVVAKSRDIYEELLSEDFSLGEAEEDSAVPKAKDSGNPYASDDEEEPADDAEDDTDDAEDDGEEPADDAEDDGDDSEEDPFGGEEGEEGEEGEGDIEDRVMDLEDALEDLKAEFEQLLQGEEHEEEQNPDVHGGALDGLPGMGGDDNSEIGAPEAGGDMDELEGLMEYVNKVAAPKGGDNGTNTRSLINNMKNDMGGTTANIAQNFSTTSGGTQGGLASPKAGDLTSGLGKIHNRKDSNAGKTAFTKKEPGHGAEKKGVAPGGNVGAGTGANSKDGEKNTQSLLRPIKK